MRISAAGTVRPPIGNVARDAERAETRGYASLFYADHLMGWFPSAIWHPDFTRTATLRSSPHDYLDPVCAVSIAATATRKLRVGLGVTDLIRHHPALVARASLTLDQLATGSRFILGLGAGEAENIVPYGLSMAEAVGRLEEGLQIIRALWEGDGPLTFEGRWWSLSDAVLDLAPTVPDRWPPIWVAARGPRMCEIAARYGDGWLPMFTTPTEYEQSLAAIHHSRSQHGRIGPFEAGLYTFVVVAESKDKCFEMFDSPVFRCLGLLLPTSAYERRGLEHPLGAGRYGLVDFVPSGISRHEALKLLERVPPEMVAESVLFGSYDDIVKGLSAYAAVGCQEAVLANVSFVTDPDLAGPSFRALDDVARRFQEAEQEVRSPG